MDIGAAVASRIQNLCRERNITVNKLATLCHITQSTLNNIVHGGSKKPTVDTIFRICRGLHISLAEFFSDPCFESQQQDPLH